MLRCYFTLSIKFNSILLAFVCDPSPKRDKLQELLSSQGVGTLIHYPIPPHMSEAYSDFREKFGQLPVAEELAATVLSLPIGPHLQEDDAERVVKGIKEALTQIK